MYCFFCKQPNILVFLMYFPQKPYKKTREYIEKDTLPYSAIGYSYVY